MVPTVQTSEWKILAEQASVEMDGAKLAVIVKKLCAALDAQSQRKPSIYPGESSRKSGRNYLPKGLAYIFAVSV